MALDRDQTLANIQERGRVSGDRFRVVVFRRGPTDAVPKKVAGLDGATYAHIAEPSAWLPPLLGGGEYTLNVYHSSVDPGLMIGIPLQESYDAKEGSPAGAPKNTPSLRVMNAQNWPGPPTLFFPNAEMIKADQLGAHPLAPNGTPRHTLTNVTSDPGVPNQSGDQGVLARALQIENEGKRQLEEAARRERELTERMARMEKENTERQEAIKRQESESKIREEMRQREEGLRAQIAELKQLSQQKPPEAPRGPSVTEIITTAATLLTPLVNAWSESAKENARATREAAEKAAAASAAAAEKNHAALMEVLKTMNSKPTGMSEEMKMLLGVLQEDKKSSSADAMAAMMTRMVDAVGVVSKMSIGMIETVAQQLGGDPEDPVVVAIREGTKAMQMLSQGAQAGAARSIPAVRQQPQPQQRQPQQRPPQQRPAGATAAGPQQPIVTPPPQQPVAAPTPIGAGTPPAEVHQFAGAPEPVTRSPIELVRAAIMGQQPADKIAGALVQLIKDKEPSFRAALHAAGGDLNGMVVAQLGPEFVMANSDYLNEIGTAVEEQGEAAGIFEDEPAASQEPQPEPEAQPG